MKKRMCVFCGSRAGTAGFADAAKSLAKAMVARDIGLVYGGASVGLMGALADAALELGGEVIGVIPPDVIAREIAHTALSQMHIVRTMHERKAKMAELSNAFIAMPGGLGTFDELFEALTWRTLGIHEKPIGIYDVGDYFLPLRSLIDQAKTHGFIDAAPIRAWSADPDVLLEALSARD